MDNEQSWKYRYNHGAVQHKIPEICVYNNTTQITLSTQ